MATKKTTTKKRTTKKIKPSDLTFEIADGIVCDVYLAPVDSEYRDSVKITCANVMVVYGSIVETDGGYFISLPSHKYKGEWKSDAFIFDKDTLELISETLINFYNEL